MHQILTFAFVAVFPALVLAAALKDVTTFTIPNWISLGLLAAYAPAGLVAGLNPGQLGVGLAVGGVMLLVGIGMFAAGWLGGGDAKLLAAASLWLGWPGVINFVLFTSVAGGALAITLMSLRRGPVLVLAARGPAWVQRLAEQKGPAPYGVAIAFGALAAFPSSPFAAVLGAFS